MKRYGLEDDEILEDFKKYWQRKGYDLIDVTPLLRARIGESGCLMSLDDRIYHIQLLYRNECIINVNGNSMEVINNDYVVFQTEDDFIVFRLVKNR